MTKLRQSAAVRGIVSLILAVCVFGASFCGWYVLWLGESGYGDSWQDNGVYSTLLSQREGDAQTAFFGARQLETGNLNYVDQMTTQAMVETLQASLAIENTNYRYQVLTADGQTVVETNLPQGEGLHDSVLEVSYRTIYQDGDDTWYILASGVLEFPQVVDEFSAVQEGYQRTTHLTVYGIVAASLAAGALVCLLLLLWAAGYHAKSATPSLCWWDKIPLEIHLILFGGGGATAIVGWYGILRQCQSLYWYHSLQYAVDFCVLGSFVASTVAVLAAAMLFGVLCTLVARLRCGMVVKTTVCYGVIHWIYCKGKYFIGNLPVLWRAAVCFGLYIAINFMARYGLAMLYPVPVFLVDGATLGVIVWWTMSFRKVREGAEAIASGNLSYRIDTQRQPHDLKELGESLNNISQGMEHAVESRIRSERFKAELITNVSHDLKTPLTSIINYVDLLKSTQQTDPRATEYIEVLERKSQRLKKLTEDLVEASKASTGTLKVEREKISMEQLLDQALGEYREKMEGRGLMLVSTIQEGESPVLADGRHLWRVLDNLLGNCVKYAMEGTRVYVELTRGHGQVELSVKNITREPITTPADQLVERFVRGDDARTSEGSGLGLSIAKSLTELQGGTFQLVVDGDLFKATLILPQAG